MIQPRLQRKKEQLLKLSWYLVVLALLFLVGKYLLPLLAPFLIGYAIAFSLKPLYVYLARKSHCSEKICGALVILIVYALFVLGLWFLGSKMVFFLGHLAANAQLYYNQYLAPLLEGLQRFFVDITRNFSPQAAIQTDALASTLTQAAQHCVTEISSNVLSSIAHLGMKLPSFLVYLTFTILSSVFISMDYHRVSSFLVKQLPRRFRSTVFEAKGYLAETVCKYLRSYLILMVITFVEISLGLALIGVSNAASTAALTALCDALPLVGTGVVLLPWSILSFLQGEFMQGVGLVALYCIVGVIRSCIEPKIIGKQLGLHPLVTLLALYLGMRAFGFVGMILFPIFLQILVSLQRSGSFRFYREETSKEPE